VIICSPLGYSVLSAANAANTRDGRIGQVELACQRRLGHRGLADYVAAVAPHAGDLGGSLEARAVGAAVAATVVHRDTDGMGRAQQAPP
jgi:hypothetical protein